MNTNKADHATFLVGQGRQLYETLFALTNRSGLLKLKIQAVADLAPDPEYPVIEITKQTRISELVYDIDALLALPSPDLVIVTQTDPEAVERLRTALPDGTTLLTPPVSSIMEGFAQLVMENRTLREDSRRFRETQLRLNKFVETAALAVYTKDTDLRFKTINTPAQQLLGLSEKEVIGKYDRQVFPGTAARWLQQVEQETLRSPRTLHARGVLPAKGRNMYVHITLFPSVENGVVAGLYGLVENTTELVESEKKLHQVDEQLDETQKYLREVLAHSRDMIFLTDPRGKLLSFNSGAEHVLGYEAKQVIGSPARNLCANPDDFEQLFLTALHEGHAAQYEAEFRDHSGNKVICNISLTLIDGPDGKPLEIVGICRDITTRLRLKGDLIRSERLAAVGQMAAGVAHEINNPLAVIDTITGAMEETLDTDGKSLPEETRDMLTDAMGRLHVQVKRVTSITHGLLGFVRKTESGLVPVNLGRLLNDCLDVTAIEVRQARVQIQRHEGDDRIEFVSDPMMLQQVFVNLIKNAIDALEEVKDRKRIIDIKSVMDGKRVIVTIEDNGVGIPVEEQEKIFNLFHTTKPAGKGTGLGLSIVHDILYRLGGTIRVSSSPGEWTRFTVEVPIEPPTQPLPDPSSVNV